MQLYSRSSAGNEMEHFIWHKEGIVQTILSDLLHNFNQSLFIEHIEDFTRQ